MNLLYGAWLFLFCVMLPFASKAELSDISVADPSLLTAQSYLKKSYTFEQLGWSSSITLNGYKPESMLYLPLSKRAIIKKITLHLNAAFSQALTEPSKIDILFNQMQISSLALPSDASKEITVDIALPVTQLSDAWQSLHFSAYLNSSKNLCSPDVWIYISPKSSITVDYIDLPFQGTLNELPYPFIELGALTPPSIQLLLPQAPQPQEIISLLQTAFKLGKQAASEHASLSSTVLSSSIEKPEDSNIILISTLARIIENTPAEFRSLILRDDVNFERSTTNGILLLNQSPYNPHRGLLIISGVNDEALDKATQAFLTNEFHAIAAGKLAIINHVETKDKDKDNTRFYDSTLKGLGYADTSISGLGRHRVSFNIPLPNDQIPKSMSINTLVTAPQLDNTGFSEITLLINDQKQNSYWIDSDHSSWNTDVNPSAMKPGLNKLDYFIDLHFDDNTKERCSRANYDEVWATIHAQTKIKTLFSNAFPVAKLNELPTPFARELSVILPEKLSNEDINLYSQLFFKLGQLFQSDAMPINFRISNQIDEDFIRNNNVILLGVIDTNPWISFALDYMPLRVKDKQRFLKLPETQLQVSEQQSTGLLELLPSPWSEGHAVLLISGNDKQGLQNAITTLMDNKRRNQLEGNVAFINSDNTFEFLNSYDNQYISPFHRFMIYLNNWGKNIAYYSANHPQIFVYLFIFLVSIVIAFRNRRK